MAFVTDLMGLGVPGQVASLISNNIIAATTPSTINFGSGAVTVITMGDSITQASYGTNDKNLTQDGFCWPVLMQYMSQGKIELLFNAGVAGENTAQMLARFTTDVLAKSPAICTFLAGRNDTGKAYELSTYGSFTNMHTMVQLCISNKIIPIIINIPPVRRSNLDGAIPVAGVHKTIYNDWLWNLWLQRYAQKYNIPFVDIFSKLYDPIANDWKAGYSADGVHPDSAATKIIAQAVLDVIQGVAPPARHYLAMGDFQNGSTAGFPCYLNSAPNGLMTTNAAGSATSWTSASAPTLTKTIVADSNILGNWQQFQCASSTNGYGLYQTVGAQFIDGATLTATIHASALNKVTRNLAWGASQIGHIMRVPYVSTPTGWIPGDYIITAISGGDATLDRNIGTVLGATAGSNLIYNGAGGGVKTGDKMFFSGLFQSEAYEPSQSFSIGCDMTGGNFRKVNSMPFDINLTGGASFAGEFTVPAAAGNLITMISYIVNTSTSSKLRHAQMGLFNLTGLFGTGNYI